MLKIFFQYIIWFKAKIIFSFHWFSHLNHSLSFAMDLKIKLFLTQFCVSLINFVRNTFNSLKNKIIGVFNAFKYVVKYLIKFNYHLICLKVLCFSLLTYNAVLVSIDYFEYPYIYKLKVIHNINGFDLPDISLCTDSKVLFEIWFSTKHT